VIELAELLLESDGVPRWFVYELVHFHRGALGSLDGLTLSRLGHGISSWGDVDSFACYLSGVVWRKGGIDDAEVHAWAASRDRWWRRTALVSTIPLNNPARGGHGDPRRTLEMCDLLKADRDDMVVKALSWALRELAKKEPELVAEYLNEAESELASRVVREVRNKLETGLKNP
jgi:3-methyladenine DNA glycosylase AlkD